MKLRINRPALIIVIILSLVAYASLTSCSIPSMFNPDSYGKKWQNTFVWIKPSSQDTLYISTYGEDLGSPSLNGIEYNVIWKESDIGKGNTVKITSNYAHIHALHITGMNERGDWEENGDTLSISGIKMAPMENGYFRLALSEDLTK